jgi:anthranilate synthase component 1
MKFRLLPLTSGISAHDVFQSQPSLFAALLEDPQQAGLHILASAAGESQRFDVDDPQALTAWHQLASQRQANDAGIIGIQHVFYAAYEAVHWLESLEPAKTTLLGPALFLHQPAWSICFDMAQQQIHLAADDEAQLDSLVAMLADVAPHTPTSHPPLLASDTIAEHGDAYRQHVEQVKRYIVAGDVFQVNIARFWHAPLSVQHLSTLYADLRRCNAAPFAAFFRAADMTILSSSPERLFHITADGCINTRPIAGTRRRGKGDDDDDMREELLLSEKEQAEHIMLVDLERNDLGRVCVPGSIEVNERMVIERYATVQHIVSNVRGQLQQGYDVVDVFRALFPGGTITGCPKVRCMEIIQQLEPQARGPYTGTLGYMTYDGRCDCNILIRTFWHQDDTLHWAAGAGIVADSIAEMEYQETNHKVAGLLAALEQK